MNLHREMKLLNVFVTNKLIRRRRVRQWLLTLLFHTQKPIKILTKKNCLWLTRNYAIKLLYCCGHFGEISTEKFPFFSSWERSSSHSLNTSQKAIEQFDLQFGKIIPMIEQKNIIRGEKKKSSKSFSAHRMSDAHHQLQHQTQKGRDIKRVIWWRWTSRISNKISMKSFIHRCEDDAMIFCWFIFAARNPAKNK